MTAALRPIALLADSRLLFANGPGGSLATDLLNGNGQPAASLRAAYIGASNGDDPQQYALFMQAMLGWGIKQTHQIMTQPSASDLEFLGQAGLVLLSGGDVRSGLASLQVNGVAEMVFRRYRSGAVIIGVSAGAVQLGRGYWHETAAGAPGFEEALGMVPFVVDVHDEPCWPRLQALSHAGELPCKAYGIPSGAALLCGPGSIAAAPGCRLAEFFVMERISRWAENEDKINLHKRKLKYKFQGDDHECT